MRLKYRGGSALNGLVRKMRNGGTEPIPNQASNAVGVDFSTKGEGHFRDQVHRGLASSANLGSGYGQGANIIHPEYNEFYKSFRSKNPDLFDQSKQQYIIDGKKVYYPNTEKGYKDFLRDSHQEGRRGDYQEDIYKGLQQEFDQYIESFGGNIENMSKDQIKRLRNEYLSNAMGSASKQSENRFG